MNKKIYATSLIIALLIIGCSEKKSTPSIMAYELSWDGNSSLLDVSLQYNPVNKDSTIFIYGDPDFGGHKDIFNVVKNIKTDSEDSLQIIPEDRKLIIYHKGMANIKHLTYTIDGYPTTGINEPISLREAFGREVFRPFICKDFLHVTGLHYLMRSDAQDSLQHSIMWANVPANMPIFNSYAANISEKTPHSSSSYRELDNSISLISPDLDVQKILVKNVPHYLVTSKTDTINDLVAIRNYAKQLYPEIMSFWNDYNHPYYFAIMLPLKSKVNKEHGSSNFALDNGFFGKYQGMLDKSIGFTLCHESVHRWLREKLIIGETSFDHQWFGEGFTEYVTMFSSIKAKLMDNKAFYEFINEENFKVHYKSPVKSMPNDSIADKFWNDDAVSELPYNRGFIFAFYLDNQIRLASNNKYTIRDLLLSLYEKSKGKVNTEEKWLTFEEFIEVSSNFMDELQLKKDIEKYIIQGIPFFLKKLSLFWNFNCFLKMKYLK